MSDRLTFSWFVGTCNLGHPATASQEALWNTVKETIKQKINHGCLLISKAYVINV
jgi:hypothetical protein